MRLAAKKIFMAGGNGFTGNYFASRLIQEAAKVTVLSRQGQKYQYPQNSKIKWLPGNVLEPDTYDLQINDADVVVSTIGTLIDTSLTRNRKHGQAGTYEQVHIQTTKAFLETLKDNKKTIFYLSATQHPPFNPRYLSTKKIAQNLLLESGHDVYIFRPGFIYDSKMRNWSIPLRKVVQGWNKVVPHVQSIGAEGTGFWNFWKNLKQDEPTSLEDMGNSMVQILLTGYEKRILENEDFVKLSAQYKAQKQGKKVE